MNNQNFSVFTNATTTTPSGHISADDFMLGIITGRWAEPISQLRATLRNGRQGDYERLKRQLNAVTLSGIFAERRADALMQHSGRLQIDIDRANDAERLRDRIGADRHVEGAFIGPSGAEKGSVKAFIRIDPDRHAESFAAAQAYFNRHYGVTIDPSVKDVGRLCFVSWDPEAIHNPDAEPLPIPPTRPRTDLGNSERLADRYGHWLKHSPSLGWLAWDGRRWELDDSAAVRAMTATIREIYQEAAETHDADQRQAMAAHAVKSEQGPRIKAALELARHSLVFATPPTAFDSAPDLLNTQDGIVELPNGDQVLHTPRYLCRKITGAAAGVSETAPTWAAFVDRIFGGDRELIAYVQEAVGYSLTGHTNEQCFFFGWGTGANGKSTFANILMALAGDYAKRLPAESLMVRYQSGVPNDIAGLVGARLVIGSEIQDGARLNEGLIKDLTGGDTISARFLHREFFEFRPALKLWIMGNHKPQVRGTDTGIWRRVRLIPFTVTIPPHEQDHQLEQKLTAELDGILAWALVGARRWYQRGRLPECGAVERATAAYRAESDALAAFLDDCCIVGDGHQATAKALHKQYQAWAADTGHEEKTPHKLGRELRDRGFLRIKTPAATWVGVGLVSDDDDF